MNKREMNKHEGTVSTCCHRVSYRYSDFETELTEELRQELEDHAEQRAKECIIEGYNNGELNFLCAETDEEIRGWWEIE